VRDDSKDNSGVYAIGESPPYPKMYAIHKAPVNPTTIGPMNCLNVDLYLMARIIPINVIIPQIISNSIDITSLQTKSHSPALANSFGLLIIIALNQFISS
jgi:hypothetical protein